MRAYCTSPNFPSFCDHLNWHIRDGENVTCPFPNCEKHFHVKSSFTSHISRKHRESLENPVIIDADASNCRHDSDIHDDIVVHSEVDDNCNDKDEHPTSWMAP